MTELTAALVELEFNTLRSDNSFKKKPEGKELFYNWRFNKKTHSNIVVAKILGTTTEAMHNMRRRLQKKESGLKERIASGSMGKDIKKKHIKKVTKTAKQIGDSNDLAKMKGGKDPEGYDLLGHIQDELTLIGGPETEDWMELLLHASKYVFINELSIYRTFVGKVLRPETEDDYKMRGLYASITDKKAGKLRDMITDNITQWGTLHTQAATETIDEQQSKIEYLAKLIVETTPGKMAEVTALLDNSSEDTTESDAIITEIMKGVKEESDQPSVVRL